jgi:16S rRNA processing protein RimM
VSSAQAAPARTSATCSRLQTDPEPAVVRIGTVGRPHGVDGAFVVEEASDDPRRFEVGAELLVDGEPARVSLSRQVGGRRRAIKLDRPAARGAELTVPRADLTPLPSDSYYVADLVGLAVFDERGTRVGVVRDVLPGPANDALELDTGLLLPLVEDCIREVDVAGRRILLNPGFTE